MKKRKEKLMDTRMAAIMLCIALILVVVSSIGASIIQTDFGRVEVSEFKIPTDEGQWITGTLYRPKEASAENQVPLVITCHGLLNNSEMQDMNAIELSRRGIAVIAYDAYYHGGSSSAELPMMEAVAANGIGMIPMVEYAWNNLDYVDHEKIGVLGHSMGGMAVWCTLMYYGTQEENKVSAGMPMGFIQFSTEEVFQVIHANMGIDYAKYDEGNNTMAKGNGDISGECPEALTALNSVLGEKEKVTSVEPGKYYGSAEDKTLRVVYNPPVIHQGLHFSTKSAENVVDFFAASFRVEMPIESRNQVWLVKEFFNLIGVIGIFLAIIPMAVLLLHIPIFSGLQRIVPEQEDSPEKPEKKKIFWLGWAVTWIISGLSFFPISKLDAVFFPDQTAFGSANVFAQSSTNFIMLWAVFNGIVGLVLFLIMRKFSRNVREQSKSSIRIGGIDFLRTLVLAVCVFVGFYLIVFASDYFCHTDFRFWVLGICTFTPDKIIVFLQYVVFYFVYYFSISITNNLLLRGSRRREKINMILSGLANMLGILILNVIQYVKLFSTGNAMWADDRLYLQVAIPLTVLLFVAAFINRSLYKATGKVWLGALVNTFIMLMIGVANTATFGIL